MTENNNQERRRERGLEKGLIQELELLPDKSGIRIKKVDPAAEYVQIPERIDSLPVKELGAYAMERSQVREMILPSTLIRIGRYAFYDCEHLESLSMSEGLKDIGTGAFTGCHKVSRIRLTIPEGHVNNAVLHELLSDFSETIDVTLFLPDGEEVRLLFPEYYEQGIENTPARIIINQYFGTGMKYRNCFVSRQLQFIEYDSLFPLAVAGELPELVMELALRRVMYPYRLEETCRLQYLNWLIEHAETVLERLINGKRLEEIRFLLVHTELPEGIRNHAAVTCADNGFAEAVSLFMEQSSTAEMQENDADAAEADPDTAFSVKSIFDLDEI